METVGTMPKPNQMTRIGAMASICIVWDTTRQRVESAARQRPEIHQGRQPDSGTRASTSPMPVASRVVPMASSRRPLVSQPARTTSTRRGQHERAQPAHSGHEIPAQNQHHHQQRPAGRCPGATSSHTSRCSPTSAHDVGGAGRPVPAGSRHQCVRGHAGGQRGGHHRRAVALRGAERRPQRREHLVFAAGDEGAEVAHPHRAPLGARGLRWRPDRPIRCRPAEAGTRRTGSPRPPRSCIRVLCQGSHLPPPVVDQKKHALPMSDPGFGAGHARC